MSLHELKIWPEYFDAVASGRKTFEVRKNDRDFRTRDILTLREWSPFSQTYSGRTLDALVTYVTYDPEWGFPPGVCVMAITLRDLVHTDALPGTRVPPTEPIEDERARAYAFLATGVPTVDEVAQLIADTRARRSV